MEQGTSKSMSNEHEDMEVSAVGVEDFIATGRTGRRNAMPDIMDAQNASVSTGGLAEGMEKLNCSDGSKAGDGAPNTQTPSSSQGS